jgi:CheY-like chemotaxis protein
MKDKPVILIVDDDPNTLLLMEAVLKPYGYDVILINDSRQVDLFPKNWAKGEEIFLEC